MSDHESIIETTNDFEEAIPDDIVTEEDNLFFADEEGNYDDEATETSEVKRAATQMPIDMERLARKLNIPTVDQLFTEMIYQVTLLQQTHGDADAALSHVLADLDMGLRSHVEMIARDPLRWLLTIVASMDVDKQSLIVDDAIHLLTLRREQLKGACNA